MKRLLCSIHDVAPRFEAQVDQLAEAVQSAQGAQPMAMLVVPNHWGDDPLIAGSRFASRLRGWAEAGTEMFVHGWFHRDDSIHQHTSARWRSRMMTAGEGEFLGLPHAVARQRMIDGRSLIEDIIGRPVSGFIAPAWLYGPGARQALRDCGFALAEDHWRVWQPANDRMVSRGMVITWASRSRMRTLSSLAVAAAARRLKHVQSDIRIAVHPGDTTKSEIMRSVDATVRAVSRSHRPSRYASLLS